MTQTKGFHMIRKPEGIVSRFERVVVDGKGHPHLALTQLYHQLCQELSDGTAQTYLQALLPYFSFLETDPWRQERQDRWDSPPENVRESVRDYLLQRLHCKVRRYGMYEMVKLSAQSPSTVRVFLSALKRFYFCARGSGLYGHTHPLMNPVVHYMAWRSPETLKAYEHYFQAIHHAQMQDVLHQQLDKKLKDYIEQARRKKHLPSRDQVRQPVGRTVHDQEVGWGSLLNFGEGEYE